GIRRGDCIALWAPNRYEWLTAALGLLAAGAALVPVNTRFKRGELAWVLRRSGARAVFSVGEFLGADYAGTLAGLRRELPRLELVIGFDGDAKVDHSLASLLRLGEAVGEDEVDARIRSIRADDVADLMFTSGTTGAPKGVPMTHAQTLRQITHLPPISGLVAGD